MNLQEILLKLTLIECELDDNNIDEAKNELYCLKDDIERLILDHKKMKDILYNRSGKMIWLAGFMIIICISTCIYLMTSMD